MRHVLLILAVFLDPAASLAGQNCSCRFKGGRVEEGMTACIQTPKGAEMARCAKNQNVTSWVPLGQPCTPRQTSQTTSQRRNLQLSQK